VAKQKKNRQSRGLGRKPKSKRAQINCSHHSAGRHGKEKNQDMRQEEKGQSGQKPVKNSPSLRMGKACISDTDRLL
jgi:hypothetical protein